MFRLTKLVQALQEAEVDFVVVGSMAMSAHGSAHATQNLELCYRRAPDNLERLVQALAPLKPRLRVEGEPEGLPFLWDAETLRRGLNFTLLTHHGDVDLLGWARYPGSAPTSRCAGLRSISSFLERKFGCLVCPA